MLICPKCGASLDESEAEFTVPNVVRGIMEGFGGAHKLGKNLADGLEKVEPGSQRHAQLHSTIRAWAADADKTAAHQQRVELLEAEQERAMVLEYLMANKDVLITAIALGRTRGLLRNESNVIEGEFEKVSA